MKSDDEQFVPVPPGGAQRRSAGHAVARDWIVTALGLYLGNRSTRLAAPSHAIGTVSSRRLRTAVSTAGSVPPRGLRHAGSSNSLMLADSNAAGLDESLRGLEHPGGVTSPHGRRHEFTHVVKRRRGSRSRPPSPIGVRFPCNCRAMSRGTRQSPVQTDPRRFRFPTLIPSDPLDVVHQTNAGEPSSMPGREGHTAKTGSHAG